MDLREETKKCLPVWQKKKRWKKRAASALLLAVLLSLLSAGCEAKRDLPFYQFTNDPEVVLVVDGVRYRENTSVVCPTNATGFFWNFTGETGDAIGVCGGDSAEQGGGFDVCPIVGDEDRNFLYVLANHFTVGPYYTYFCIREDLQITLPSAQTVSSVSVVCAKDGENVSVQVDDPGRISALFAALQQDGIQIQNNEDWVYGSFTMRHKDYPFFQCEMDYCYSLEQRTAYCQNADREWSLLPDEWYAIVSEQDISVAS